MIKLIFCSDLVGNVGKDNDLIFKYKEDMKFFRETTLGSTVLMGYKTYESLGSKPLPKRINMVLTRREEYELDREVIVVRNLEKAIEDFRKNYPNEDLYVIGGAMVYNKCLELDLVDEVLITLVNTVAKESDTKVELAYMFDNLPYREKLKEFTSEDDKKVEIFRYYK